MSEKLRVGNAQIDAAQYWSIELGSPDYNYAFRESLPRDLEMLMRNPAVYINRLKSGEISGLPNNMAQRWAKAQREAGAICDAVYAFSDRESTFEGDNRLNELQYMTYTGKLLTQTRDLVRHHLVETASVFHDSLQLVDVRENLLGYFSGCAEAAIPSQGTPIR